MSGLGQRVDLIHELRKLTATEEITHHGRERLGVDQLVGGHIVGRLVKNRHALFHQTLCPGQSNTTLVGKQFTNGSDTAAAQVINIIHSPLPHAKTQEVTCGIHDIISHHDTLFLDAFFQTQLLDKFITAHTSQVITAGIKKQTLDQSLCIISSRGISRAQAAINFLKCIFFILDGVFLEALDHDAVIHRGINNANILDPSIQNRHQHGLGKRLKSSANRGSGFRIQNVIGQSQVFQPL